MRVHAWEFMAIYTIILMQVLEGVPQPLPIETLVARLAWFLKKNSCLQLIRFIHC